MLASWLFTQKKPLKIIILDKTVLTEDAVEHKGLYWTLKHRKYVKHDNTFYRLTEDYLGFFPGEDKHYEIKDLDRFSVKQIDSIADRYDMLYYTDTYGMYANEWYFDTLQSEHSEMIYGGLSLNDYLLLERMKEKKKLIITEFNLMAHPTSYSIRKKVENLFNFNWTGWTLRYFESLDTSLNQELPHWVVHDFMVQHNNKWPFRNSGIVFVYEDNTIFILENKSHLEIEVPVIYTTALGQEKYNLPEKFNYPYWIDVINVPDSTNNILASYSIHTNKAGDSLLRFYNVPPVFPAVIEHSDGYPFYYFAGDFCDNPVSSITMYFRGISWLKRWFSERNDLNNRQVFFWNYYYPMMKEILNDYYAKVEQQQIN